MDSNKSDTKIGTECSIDSSAYIGPGVKVGDKCKIGFGSRLSGEVRLGNRVWIDTNVTLYGNVSVEDRVYIGSDSILGHLDRRRLKRVLAGGDLISIANESHLEIGEGCTIRQGCIFYSPGRIGRQVEFGHNVLVRENVTIGERTLVGTGVVIDGESKIGHDVSIQTSAYISRRSEIGDRVFLGPRCVLLNDKYMTLKKSRLVGPVIGEGAAIGGNSTLMPGIHVGKRAVVGSGAVVTCDVPDGMVYVGVPAKKLKKTPKDWRSLLGRRF